MATKRALLSTSDNPWNPWTHYDEWYSWDAMHGYHTPAYLARIITSSDELSDADQDLDYDVAVSEILEFNLTGNYITVPEPEGSEVSS